MKPKFWSILPAIALGTCVAAITVTLPGFSEAQAYTVIPNGRTAGNPSGQPLNDIILDSRFDQNRILDPITWSLAAGTKTDDGKNTLTQSILARAIVTIKTFKEDQLSLTFNLSNLTNSSYQAAVMSLWFGVTPNPTSASTITSTTNVFADVTAPKTGNAPGGFKNIDVCLYAANNCNGGTINGGLQAGQSDAFTVNIFGNFATGAGYSQVTLSDMGLKFQTQDGSYELAGVPEPLTILGSAAALGFAGAIKQRISQKKLAKV